MATTIVEHFESQEVSRSMTDLSVEIKAVLIGSEDTVAVEQEFLAWLATVPQVAGMPLAQTTLKHVGGGVHEGTASFRDQPAEVVKTYRYRTTGQTTRIIQGYGTQYKAALTGTAPDFKGLIGVSSTGVDGVDVPIPSFDFSIDYRFSSVSESYLNMCANLTGSVNSTPYLGRDTGELLFLGIEGEVGMTSGGAISLSGSPISFSFSVSPNATNLVVGDFTIPFKYGWDYLWPRTREETSENSVIRKTTHVYVDRVHPFKDLTALGI